MKQAVTFKLPVYKDQGTPSNVGLIVVPTDTVDVAISNNTAAPTIQTLTVTGVFNGGRTIEWDASTTGNLRPEDIIRVHAKHQYNCPGALNYQIVLTEHANADSTKAKVTSMVFNGVTYAIDIEEAATAADGILQEFVTRLVDKINSVLGLEGYATAVLAGAAGTMTVTITINALTLAPGTVTVVGLVAGSWTEV